MKKTYLAPKSETLMAVLQEICQMPGVADDPSGMNTGSGMGGLIQAPRVGAPAAGHSL